MKYSDKFLDPRWQKKRLEILDLRGWACEICCNKEETLHVHHSIYFSNLEPWEYETTHLRVLCGTCHTEEHDEEENNLYGAIDWLRAECGFTFKEIDWILHNGYRVLTDG